jgi:hypothetical protein
MNEEDLKRKMYVAQQQGNLEIFYELEEKLIKLQKGGKK